MKNILTLLTVVLCLYAMQLKAQSVCYAKSLIEAERYLEAAKQLQPLANNGDAEAQYLAATLFFEGKGVQKSVQQGIKYATLSANQGNENSVVLLADYYYGAGNHQKLFGMLKDLIGRHPYMEEKLPGTILGLCYLNGYGTEKDAKRGRELLDKNKDGQKRLGELSPRLAEAMPALMTNVGIKAAYGYDGDTRRSVVYADDAKICFSYDFEANKTAKYYFSLFIQRLDGTLAARHDASIECGPGKQSYSSWFNIEPLPEGKYVVAIVAGDNTVLDQKSFQVQSAEIHAEKLETARHAEAVSKIGISTTMNVRGCEVNNCLRFGDDVIITFTVYPYIGNTEYYVENVRYTEGSSTTSRGVSVFSDSGIEVPGGNPNSARFRDFTRRYETNEKRRVSRKDGYTVSITLKNKAASTSFIRNVYVSIWNSTQKNVGVVTLSNVAWTLIPESKEKNDDVMDVELEKVAF